MKKVKNKIIIIGLAFLLVCVVGYALFSENINISGTASAKGDFEFTATCQPGLSTEVPDSFEKMMSDLNSQYGSDYPTIESGYNSDICSVSGKTVTFKTNLEYPSAIRVFTVKITNTGSIPISLDFNNFGVEEQELVDGVPHSNSIDQSAYAYYEKGINMALFDNPKSKLLPGESSYIVLGNYWMYSDNANDGKEQSYISKFTFPFVQSTE